MSIPLLSFFTGGGFLDIGFLKAGFEIVWTNESNNAFADMYEYGIAAFAKSMRKTKDSWKVSDRRSIIDISANTATRHAFPNGKPQLFGVIGGPPCPDFSNGGKHKGHEGDHGRLTKVFVDRICEIDPGFFVLENVPGLIRRIKHRQFFTVLERQIGEAGYCIDVKLLNALDLGLAQDRERVIVVGIKKKILNAHNKYKSISVEQRNWFPWPVFEKYNNAKNRFDWPTVVQRGEQPRVERNIPHELMVIHLLSGSNPPDALPNGTEAFVPYSRKFRTKREGDTSGKSFKRLHRYRYSPTACYGNNEVHLHPWENRRLTVREVMRIQGVPDSYALPEEAPLTYKYKLIANGVPVPLAYHIAIKLHRLLNKRRADS